MLSYSETPYSKKVEELIHELGTDPERGLSEKEAHERLQKFGKNKLKEKKKISPFLLYLKQYKDFMMLILLAVSCISFLIHDKEDGTVILAVVILNTFISFIQEYKAEKTLSALKKIAGPEAQVVRDDIEKKIRAELLVPGDVISIEEGDFIPADARLIELAGLRVQEALLTGESEPVEKGAQVVLSERVPVSDRRNMVFAGTVVASGRGKAVVTSTGMTTEVGQIADLIQKVKDKPTPLQIKLAQLGRWLVVLSIFLCAVIAAIGILRGLSPYQMFLTAVSLGVAVIPEGLPAVVTIALSIGVQRMARRNAIVKRLPAVETLGSVTVIGSDKTGTLTEGVMRAEMLWTPDSEVKFVEGHSIVKGMLISEGRVLKKLPPDVEHALLISALANNAVLQKNKTGWEAVGDPTETALACASAKGGYWREKLEEEQDYTFLTELPFDAQRKMMSVIMEAPDDRIRVFTKGAPEEIVKASTRYYSQNEKLPLTGEQREKILLQNKAMAEKGLRVIGLAYRKIDEVALDVEPEDVEEEMVFVGLIGIFDPPRQEVPAAIQECTGAGIQTLMITGDHVGTATNIAGRIGMIHNPQECATGRDLDRFSEKEWDEKIPKLKVFARVSPQHKFQIVKTLQKAGQFVAMTGDGINDAPAIKNANVGIAMGRTGTDVTREASDIVLTDDNFSTIVAAVEEGRTIYNNIKKFIAYLFSCNAAEILIMMISVIIGFPLPLTPIQILWLNLVTDTPPALALGVEPAPKGIMTQPPRDPKESIFSHRLFWDIFYQGLAIALSVLFVFWLFINKFGSDLTHARTGVFVTLALSQLLHAFNCQNEKQSIFSTGLFTNGWLIVAIVVSTLLLLSGMYLPFLKNVFGQVPLSAAKWAVCLLVALIPVGVVECVKLFFKRRSAPA